MKKQKYFFITSYFIYRQLFAVLEETILLYFDMKMKLFCWCFFDSESYFLFEEVDFLGGNCVWL
jgi:hypothetical protein